ncbi:gp53-like domain-containing protein [Amantichitinum ursilacus]|uniref:Putative tail fiber protein gp53-like C-terminal domain-containing protein n=1 Tax=Amantichitinum ursilacus TaxID=857265 RepID=A0A0N1JSI4_9NEIS|nr:hypothetical protein [Amantichitinum ursilacus]KPC53037.1 hypothetical protein WG78_11120 [Amantichitinum ursilacus]
MDYPKSVPNVNLLNGKFTDGNPLTGQLPSLDTSSWANAITDEQLAIIVAAGLAPDETKTNQVLTAVQLLIRKQVGNFSGSQTVSASKTLTAAMAGTTTYVSSATAVTLTLPPIASTSYGDCFPLMNANAGLVTIAPAAGESLYFMGNGVSSNKALGSGDTAYVVNIGTGAWNVISGSIQLAVSAAFAALRSPSGYQKLPGGLILQWGSVADTAAGTNRDMPYNIAFPTACVCLEISPWQNAVGLPYTHTSRGTTPNILRTVSAGAWAFDWFAIGY